MNAKKHEGKQVNARIIDVLFPASCRCDPILQKSFSNSRVFACLRGF
jgi:hypothetical protein